VLADCTIVCVLLSGSCITGAGDFLCVPSRFCLHIGQDNYETELKHVSWSTLLMFAKATDMFQFSDHIQWLDDDM